MKENSKVKTIGLESMNNGPKAYKKKSGPKESKWAKEALKNEVVSPWE